MRQKTKVAKTVKDYITSAMSRHLDSPYGFSIWMAGAGIKGGQVIGATDDFGFRAVETHTRV